MKLVPGHYNLPGFYHRQFFFPSFSLAFIMLLWNCRINQAIVDGLIDGGHQCPVRKCSDGLIIMLWWTYQQLRQATEDAAAAVAKLSESGHEDSVAP